MDFRSILINESKKVLEIPLRFSGEDGSTVSVFVDPSSDHVEMLLQKYRDLRGAIYKNELYIWSGKVYMEHGGFISYINKQQNEKMNEKQCILFYISNRLPMKDSIAIYTPAGDLNYNLIGTLSRFSFTNAVDISITDTFTTFGAGEESACKIISKHLPTMDYVMLPSSTVYSIKGKVSVKLDGDTKEGLKATVAKLDELVSKYNTD